jgi:23S rRNA (pseudouridine1915-N3)-methyltransferase
MINIQIICIGKIKEKSLINLCDEYLKRISKYAKISVTELLDEKVDKVLSEIEMNKIKSIECNRIIDKIAKSGKSYVICLDLTGKSLSSTELADKISNIATYSSSNIIFVIGGSLGLNEELLKMSNELISFSTLTFPHQLIRVFLLEQIFRSFKILNNETYHH